MNTLRHRLPSLRRNRITVQHSFPEQGDIILVKTKKLLKEKKKYNIDYDEDHEDEWWIPPKDVLAIMSMERVEHILNTINSKVMTDADNDRALRPSLAQEIFSNGRILLAMLVIADLSHLIGHLLRYTEALKFPVKKQDLEVRSEARTS